MFLKFTKQSGLVREDLVVSTELITTVQKGASKLPVGVSTVVTPPLNASPIIEIKSNIPGVTGNGQVQTINLGTQNYTVTEKEQAFYIFIFMRDPILNKSHNNRTFNNAVILEFKESSYSLSGGIAQAEAARDAYWTMITGAAGLDAKVIEDSSFFPDPVP
ncbi:MAG: hypothetical protein ACPGJS_05435 [Flammeovirgaceae bacterium]